MSVSILAATAATVLVTSSTILWFAARRLDRVLGRDCIGCENCPPRD